jgi:hypothetical protein
MERHEFPEGEEPEVLTAILNECEQGKHDECPGYAQSDAHGGETVFCVCQCHRVQPEDLPYELR